MEKAPAFNLHDQNGKQHSLTDYKGKYLVLYFYPKDDTPGCTKEACAFQDNLPRFKTSKAVVLGDLPFGSYQISPEQAFESGARLMAAGATMVKLEGGAAMAPAVEFMAGRGIPVCGHLGLTPQSVFTLGGFKVQGKTEEAAQRVIEDAKTLERAGACMIVLEAVPSDCGRQMQEALSIPVIGIGAGPHCAGQILLMYDMLDIYRGKKAKFVKNFMTGAPSILAALETFVREVKSGAFPSPEYCY